MSMLLCNVSLNRKTSWLSQLMQVQIQHIALNFLDSKKENKNESRITHTNKGN